ncbi:uncharacterized protein VICG_01834 [Vittaforma corneae ATCC 50505]|uniref:Uncharacterized protein n=1 Tax=Vittaforma corneae (strain ATCC 50505) TaxID=993615 RepID=L2GKY0_VITCO|nr:uncharacterized protein VICG_01834 [Vittaforma corneae ATCC 50505]ELA41135.1 hypothetical protein VICG_01834 [Vittaforma corneae ATCC 50505]
MPLTLKQIDETILFMDKTYDANFGNWIRNEDNCKIVGCSLKKYLECYRESEFITVLKWIVKDWTLKSIILLSKKLILEDIIGMGIEAYTKRIRVLSGLIFTWNPIFISEFILACTVELTVTQKTDFMVSILNVFDSKKLSEILSQIESKIDVQTKKELVRKFKDSVYLETKDQWKRRGSMLEAYNIM